MRPAAATSTTTRTVDVQVSVPSDSFESVGISYADARTPLICTSATGTSATAGTQLSYLSCHDRNAWRGNAMLELQGRGGDQQPGDEHPLVVEGLLVHQVEAGQQSGRAEQEPMRHGPARPPDQGISREEDDDRERGPSARGLVQPHRQRVGPRREVEEVGHCAVPEGGGARREPRKYCESAGQGGDAGGPDAEGDSSNRQQEPYVLFGGERKPEQHPRSDPTATARPTAQRHRRGADQQHE